MKTTTSTPDNYTRETVAAVAAIIAEAEYMKNAYFWRSPMSAGARRSYERQHTRAAVTWTEGGHTYTAAYTVRCTCGNIYAAGDYTRDGERTTLLAIRNSHKRMAAALGA